jgi:hypothetical protein
VNVKTKIPLTFVHVPVEGPVLVQLFPEGTEVQRSAFQPPDNKPWVESVEHWVDGLRWVLHGLKEWYRGDA